LRGKTLYVLRHRIHDWVLQVLFGSGARVTGPPSYVPGSCMYFAYFMFSNHRLGTIVFTRFSAHIGLRTDGKSVYAQRKVTRDAFTQSHRITFASRPYISHLCLCSRRNYLVHQRPSCENSAQERILNKKRKGN